MNYSDKVEKLIKLMKDKDIDAVLISKRENYIYFSGFNGTSAYLLISKDAKFLFTDSRYLEQASMQAKGFQVIDYKAKLNEALKDASNVYKIKRIGIESAYVSYDSYKKYKENKIWKEIVTLGSDVDKIRAVKAESEIETIKKAVLVADNAFSHVLKYIKPGVSELEIAAEIEFFMKKNGAKGVSFETIVASGKRSSLPHGLASTKKIEVGDPVIIDFGAIVDDYCSDMTRTIFVGRPSDEMKKVYETVRLAQEEAAEKISSGMQCKQADAVARDVISQRGYAERFGHGLGHGVGIEIHEAPTLSVRSEAVLENNMVVTVEPGIYLPEFGGVRIEDMVVIKDNHPIILTKAPKNCIVL